jgi:hypothetical protein
MISGVTINTDALDRTVKRLAGLANVQDIGFIAPLLDNITLTIIEDNRRGVMLGTDKNDKPAPPLRYRTASRFQPSKARSMKGGYYGRADTRFKGKAPARGNMLPHNNLTTAQYQQMSGPRLAPRRDSSRVIANLVAREPFYRGGVWWCVAAWADVFDRRGRSLLPKHFDNPDPRMHYDLRGVRAWGRKRAADLARQYFLKAIRAYT